MAKDSGGEEEVGNVNGKVVDMVGSGSRLIAMEDVMAQGLVH
jgi:hypothetical protein